jgi:hypothetical protein
MCFSQNRPEDRGRSCPETVVAARRIHRAASRANPRSPVKPAQDAAANRLWHDAAGLYEVEARMLSLSDAKVTLQKKDGRKVIVPLEKLTPPDQAWAKEHAKPKPPNPFE